MDYDEFGTVEQFLPDRLVIKPQKLGLPLDVVLFDRHGTFIGPVVQITDQLFQTKYVVHVDEDSLLKSKSTMLKPGDSVYYYNCDRMSVETGDMKKELNLLDKKRQLRQCRKKNRSRVNRQVMQDVIDNLRDLKLDFNQVPAEDCMEEDQKSTSKNTKSIASIVLNSHCNRKVIGDQLEKQKGRRYKRIKAKILGDICKFREENNIKKERIGGQIEDELELGKRRINPRTINIDLLVSQSIDYSKNSFEVERNNSFNGDRMTSSDRSSKLMFEETLTFPSFMTEKTDQKENYSFFMSRFDSKQE